MHPFIKNKKTNIMNKAHLIYLESVGYYFNPQTKMLSRTKEFFYIGSFHITTCSKKWKTELSKQDLKTIFIDCVV